MSYILDALKKANAEREHGRGAAPSLYTQPVRGVSESPDQIGVVLKKRNALLLALVVALFLCAVIMGALFWSPLKMPVPSSTSAPPSAQTATMAPTFVSSTGPTSPSTMTAPTDTPPVPTVPVRVTPPPYSLPPPGPTPPETLSTPPAKPQPPAVSTRPRPAPTQPAQPTPVAPSPLPASVRAALPSLVISGSTYSDNPTYRMLIVNGQVYREGEFLTPEFKLEQIKQKSALLRYNGNTYVLPY